MPGAQQGGHRGRGNTAVGLSPSPCPWAGRPQFGCSWPRGLVPALLLAGIQAAPLGLAELTLGEGKASPCPAPSRFCPLTGLGCSPETPAWLLQGRLGSGCPTFYGMEALDLKAMRLPPSCSMQETPWIAERQLSQKGMDSPLPKKNSSPDRKKNMET